jgi:micrococcal nuclease
MLRMILRAMRRPRRNPSPTPAEHAHTVIHLPPRKAEGPSAPDRTPPTPVLKGKCYVVDGDTINISGTSIRIAGIDAPELHHPWGRNARSAMIALCKGQVVTAVIQPEVSYDRIVAKCYLPDGTDLAAELVRQGLALDWPRFSGGAYRHLEPEGIRKKHWRAAAKQQGKLKAADM